MDGLDSAVTVGGRTAKVTPLAVATTAGRRRNSNVDDEIAAAAAEAEAAAKRGDQQGGVSALDLERWDDDDIILREIVERLEHHRSAIDTGFGRQARGTTGLLAALREEAETLKRMLARSSFERDVAAAASRDDDERRATVASAVADELSARALFDRRLQNAENELANALAASRGLVEPGPDVLADSAVEEMREGKATSVEAMAVVPTDSGAGSDEDPAAGGGKGQQSAGFASATAVPVGMQVDDDSIAAASNLPKAASARGAPVARRIVPESVVGTIRASVLAIDTAARRLASVVSDERSRRETAVPLWKATAELGAGGQGEELLSGLERAHQEEEGVESSAGRLLESVSPLTRATPRLLDLLQAAIVENAEVLEPAYIGDEVADDNSDRPASAGSERSGMSDTGVDLPNVDDEHAAGKRVPSTLVLSDAEK